MELKTDNWWFPKGECLIKQGLNHSGLETFMDNPLESLVRETIQNSLDAKSPASQEKPVRVEFEFFDRPIKDMPGINSLMDDYIPKSKKSWGEDSKEYGYLQMISDKMRNDLNIKILRISDYNTTGLDESNWNALVTETGVSNKSDNQAGGSKGIGKNAPFAASDFRAVIYNTKTEEYEKSIGVMIGVSYTEQGDYVSQPLGFFGPSKNKPYEHQYAFSKDRNEIGTDVFIIGVKREYSESQDIIILNVLENFLLSIYNGTLEVDVDNNSINKMLLSKRIEALRFPEDGKEYNRLQKIKKYYDVLINEATQLIYLNSTIVDKYPFIDSINDASFLLLTADTQMATTQQVLMVRKSGMKIKEQNFRNVGLNFSGIFQATGSKLNTFLRSLEGAEHSNWTPERADFENQDTARKFLCDIQTFLRDTIRSFIETRGKDEIDAYGLAELLPDENATESKNEADNTGSINTDIASVTIRPVKKIRQQLRYEEEDPEVDGPGGGQGLGDAGRVLPTRNQSGPPNPNPDPPGTSPSKKLVEVVDAQIRPVELDYKNGLYELRIITGHTLSEACIKLALSGENGDYDVKVESVDENKDLSIDDIGIRLSLIPANTLMKIKIKINYSYRVRLKAVVYEDK